MLMRNCTPANFCLIVSPSVVSVFKLTEEKLPKSKFLSYYFSIKTHSGKIKRNLRCLKVLSNPQSKQHRSSQANGIKIQKASLFGVTSCWHNLVSRFKVQIDVKTTEELLYSLLTCLSRGLVFYLKNLLHHFYFNDFPFKSDSLQTFFPPQCSHKFLSF